MLVLLYPFSPRNRGCYRSLLTPGKFCGRAIRTCKNQVSQPEPLVFLLPHYFNSQAARQNKHLQGAHGRPEAGCQEGGLVGSLRWHGVDVLEVSLCSVFNLRMGIQPLIGTSTGMAVTLVVFFKCGHCSPKLR